METSPNFHENQNPSLLPSPNSRNSNCSSPSSSCKHNRPTHVSSPAAPPPIPLTRSDPNNPYPTTFIQADTSSFKQVVQMLTGSSETAKQVAGSSSRSDPVKNPIPAMKTGLRKEKGSKLYERRNSMKNFKISPLIPGMVNSSGYSVSPRKPGTPELLSPSMLNFPGLALSPVTPLLPDPFNRSPHNGVSPTIDMEAENKAISQKGFYLHPSPSNTPRGSEPRLLPLFPVTSPRVSGRSNSS